MESIGAWLILAALAGVIGNRFDWFITKKLYKWYVSSSSERIESKIKSLRDEIELVERIKDNQINLLNYAIRVVIVLIRYLSYIVICGVVQLMTLLIAYNHRGDTIHVIKAIALFALSMVSLLQGSYSLSKLLDQSYRALRVLRGMNYFDEYKAEINLEIDSLEYELTNK